MKYVKLYEDFSSINDSGDKKITTEWFNTVTEPEINRFVVGFNDGQGDHSFYTYAKIVELLKDSDRLNKKSLDDMTRVEIIDEFYEELQLTANNSDMIYFNGKEYQKVKWAD